MDKRKLMDEIKDFLHSDEDIPSRLAICNALMLIMRFGLLGSSKVTVKAICIIGEALVIFQMNRDTAKFIEYVMYRLRTM